MRRIALIAVGALLGLLLIVGGFAYMQISDERVEMASDLQYRTRVVADSLEEAIAPSFARQDTATVARIIMRIADNERIAGIVVFDNMGIIVAQEKEWPAQAASSTLVTSVMDSAEPSGTMVRDVNGSRYVLATPLFDGSHIVIGALVVVQNASYIDERIVDIWLRNIERLFALFLLMGLVIAGLVHWVFRHPLERLSRTLQAVRRGDVSAEMIDGDGLLAPLASEISKVTTSLHQARRSASEEARMRLEKLDSPWTAERLKEFVRAYVKDRPIFALSNAEPYMHRRVKGKIEWSVPAGGVVTALDSVMAATGGIWIAHGKGDADRDVVDKDGKIKVPPEEPRYTLKRVWLTDEEVRGYYNGFSNEALWPLCHMAHVRPIFRKEDWDEYKKVNVHFAKALLEEIRHIERPLVLVQDFHLALVPALIKKSRPDAQVALFWHIPWPSAAQFSICPWRKEILLGILGADLFGFHTQQYCNNFLDTVANEIEARIDFEHFSVHHDEHRTLVRPFPISIAFSGGEQEKEKTLDRTTLDRLNIHTEHLLLGVDRLDYTKGILERFRGFEFLLAAHPEYREKVTFLQIAAPTRESVEKYREYAERVKTEVQRINETYGSRNWRPIVLEHRNYAHKELHPLYRIADACVVTPLHDGMNLVAKEYVAARDDNGGTLILSNFTGASRDLKGARIVNPYSAEDVAEALREALTMPKTEQHRRMKTMRDTVRDYNVYRWSAEIIKTLARLD